MANVISVNFEGVESGGNRVRVPEGDYALKVTKVVSKIGGDSGQPYLLFSLKITQGNASGVGKVIPHNCSLQKNSLWNLRNLLEASGKTIPAKAIKIDLDKLVGLTMAGTIIDDEPYENKIKSIVSAFFPLADLNAEKKEDEENLAGDAGAESEEPTEEEGEDLFE